MLSNRNPDSRRLIARYSVSENIMQSNTSIALQVMIRLTLLNEKRRFDFYATEQEDALVRRKPIRASDDKTDIVVRPVS